MLAVLLASTLTGACAQIPICILQGSGTSSAYNGQAVTTTGVVTALFSGTGTLQGFFIEDPACDADASTSNGLFIYNPNTTGIALGDRVSVSGTVQEFQTLTELYAISSISVIGSGTVQPTDVTLPLSSASAWERYEGMLIRFPGTMTVTGNDDWAQYGELVMAPDRLWNATHVVDPNDADPDGTTVGGLGNVAAVNAAEVANALSSIILDDGRTTSWPDPPPLISAQGTLRCGSTVFNLTGVLHYMYSRFRLQPVSTIPMVHYPRPAPRLPDAALRIVSWNVHNYWSTLGGFGAANATELARQRTKLTVAMEMMDADAFVLCELENNDVAWVDLIAGLNALYGSTAYLGVEQNAGFGTKSVIFYKPDVLTLVTPLYSYYSSTFERAHITQGFEVIATGGRFLLSGMHLRSKLCDNATGANLDLGDGQGCYNARRLDQVSELVSHWADLRTSTGIDAQLVMGDFNAYLQEDPIDLMRVSGFTALVMDGIHDYTFRYQDRFGAIDHAFGTEAMANAVVGAEPWAINADEPPVLDYPDANIDFYQPNAYRSSDHDPVVVGIDPAELVVGVEAVAHDRSTSFTFDAAQGIASWHAIGLVGLELADAVGRSVGLQASRTGNTITMRTDALAPGVYAWRCIDVAGRAISVGRFAVAR
ncbi:MAG: ExeM/NucH family extracellular endonuclease [Flavobacteriales bacterium]|nr:ExeM/NucH family extracellular endonuclease [Flavobacteriales bacterium]